jgi:hypothetical protein
MAGSSQVKPGHPDSRLQHLCGVSGSHQVVMSRAVSRFGVRRAIRFSLSLPGAPADEATRGIMGDPLPTDRLVRWTEPSRPGAILH